MNKLTTVLVFLLGLGSGLVAMQAAVPLRAQESEPLVTGIGGIFFKANDQATLSQWYAEHLGLQSPGQGVNFFWREVRDAGKFGMSVWSLFPRESDYFGDSDQAFMINYRVSDLDTLLANLAAAGVAQVKPREDYEYGSFAWVLDSEGNRIELWQPAEMTEVEYRALVNAAGE